MTRIYDHRPPQRWHKLCWLGSGLCWPLLNASKQMQHVVKSLLSKSMARLLLLLLAIFNLQTTNGNMLTTYYFSCKNRKSQKKLTNKKPSASDAANRVVLWPLEKVGFIRGSVGRSTADVEQRQWSTSSAVCVKRRRVVMRCSVRSLLPGGKATAITDRHVNKKASHHRARRTKRCRMFDLTFNI